MARRVSGGVVSGPSSCSIRKTGRSEVDLAHPWRDGGEGVVRHRNTIYTTWLRLLDLPAKRLLPMAGWRGGDTFSRGHFCSGQLSMIRMGT
jgi:hypothetical protein